VPALTGLSVQATLLFAGLGTLLFHFLAKGKVPAFLGSSFAFIAGYAAIAPNGEPELLPYACLGVAAAGCLYLVLAALFKAFGTERVMKYFPPVVTGPIVICIGLILSSSAINNCAADWRVAIVAIVVIILCNIFGKGMVKVVPILLGVVASFAVAAILGDVDFAAIARAYGCVGYTIRTQEELEKAIEESKAIKDQPVLFDVKVLPKSMTEGYGSWWRVGSVEVGGTEANRAAWQNHLDHVKDARQY
jgi:hypothetical protein